MKPLLHAPQRITPLAEELRSIFAVIPADELLQPMGKKPGGRGRPPYAVRPLFNAFVASYVIGTGSTSEIARLLEDNPSVADACGFDQEHIPSRPTLGRFFRRIAKHSDAVQDALGAITTQLKEALPDFGSTVAIDASTVRVHSNPDKKPLSDPEASWTAKGYKVGSTQKQWHFGYKLHLMVDAVHELPITAYVTSARSADSVNLLPLLERGRDQFDWFRPTHVLADRGYDALGNYSGIVENFKAFPVIPIRAMRAGAKKRRPGSEQRTSPAIGRETAYWKRLYAQRTSVERTFGRLKQSRRLEKHCFRGLAMIEMHCLMSVLTLQARALVQHAANADLRACLRRVA